MFMLEEFCSGVLMSKSDKKRLSHHCCLAFNADSALGISAKRLDLRHFHAIYQLGKVQRDQN